MIAFLSFVRPNNADETYHLSERNLSKKVQPLLSDISFGSAKNITSIKEFKDNLDSINDQKDYFTCNFFLIDSVVARDKERKNIADYLTKPFALCPSIKYSCCSDTELKKLFKVFQKNASLVKHKLDLLYETFVKYAEMKDFIINLMNEFSKDDEECAERSQKELLDDLYDVIRIAVYKKSAIDNYLRYVIDVQSGFVCSLCDGEYQQYMYIDDKPTFVVNANQCMEFYIQKFAFLEIELGVARLANLIRGIQCKIHKTSDEMFAVNKNYFILLLNKLLNCYTNKGTTFIEDNEKCHTLCKRSITLNKFKNNNNYLNVINGALIFYNDVLYPQDLQQPFKPVPFRKEPVSYLPTIPGGKYDLSDYSIQISLGQGLYPYSEKMDIDVKSSGSKNSSDFIHKTMMLLFLVFVAKFII